MIHLVKREAPATEIKQSPSAKSMGRTAKELILSALAVLHCFAPIRDRSPRRMRFAETPGISGNRGLTLVRRSGDRMPIGSGKDRVPTMMRVRPAKAFGAGPALLAQRRSL